MREEPNYLKIYLNLLDSKRAALKLFRYKSKTYSHQCAALTFQIEKMEKRLYAVNVTTPERQSYNPITREECAEAAEFFTQKHENGVERWQDNEKL